MKKQDTAAFSLIRCDTEKKMPALAVRAIRAALFFAGLLAAAQGAAGIWTNYGWLWAAAGAAALVWQSVALGLPRRWLRAVLPLLCLICAAAFSRRFLAGAITVSSAAGETLTKATGHILLPLAGVGADAALFVAISAALLGTLCAYAVRWSPTVCGLLLTVLSAALLALLRPDAAQVWMAVCPLCAALLLAGGAADRKESVPMLLNYGVLLAAAGVLAAALLAVPGLRSGTLFSEWGTASRTALHRLRYESGQAVLPEGEFSNYSAAPEQTSCLTVTMEQPTALYLRGFTGDTFTGTAWQALDAQTLAEQTDLLYWLHKEGFYPQTQLAAASRGLHRQEQTQTVLIENTSACSAYVYAPYALSALPQESALRTDSLESTQLPTSGLRGARQYRLTIPLAPEQNAAELLDALREQPEKADAYLSAEGSYRAFVQEQDVTLPAQIRAQLAPILDEFCREYGSADSLTPEQAQLCTARFLEQLDALREAGTPLPLDESIKGTTYQTATLTVLALRYYGIPARYAEGFVLTQETAARAQAGSAITLTAADAQGWAEVYQDGVGWMPLALTPGYGELTDILSPHQSEAASQTGDTHTDNGSIAQAETIENESDETEDTQQEQPEGGAQSAPTVKMRLWLWILLIVGLLLFLLAAAALRYALIRRRWRYRFEHTAPAQSVAWVTGALAALWPAMGLGYDGGSVFAFGESLRETDAEYAGAVCEIAALNGEARFSSHAMTREQAKRARRVWKQTIDRLQKTVPLPRRAWLKWIRCLY